MKIKYNTNSLEKLSDEYLARYGIQGKKPKNSIDYNKKYVRRYTHIFISETKEKNKPKLLRQTTISSLKTKNRITTSSKNVNYKDISKSNKDFKSKKQRKISNKK